MALGWGFGEGKSISVFDHLVGKPVIAEMIHGKDYSSEYAKLGQGLSQSKALSNAALMKALAAIDKGYGNADSALAMQGSVATKAILDRERQNLAASKNSLIDRGLYSTTTADAVNRGITSATNQDLNSLAAELASLGSNIKISHAQDVAGLYGGVSGNEQNYAQLALTLGLNTEYGKQGGMGGSILGSIFGGIGG